MSNQTKINCHGNIRYRYKVIACLVNTIKREKKLTVSPTHTSIETTNICILKDTWYHTVVDVDDIVNIHSVWNKSNEESPMNSAFVAIIDSGNGLIIVNPDYLIPGTLIKSSLICTRKAVLLDRFCRTEPSTVSMIVGKIVHRLLQKALIEETYDVSSLSAIIENIIKDKSIIQDLYGANISTQELKKSVMPFVNFVKMFVDKYKPLSKGKKPSSESGWSRNLQNKNAWDGSIDYIIDIEENIWSPSLGMKGRIDITTVVNDVKRGILTMPFEVKTGHLKTPSNEDTCQVVMYSMMKNSETLPVVMKQEHYNTGGLLLYIQSGIIYHVSVEHKEKRDVVQKRNELVNYLTILKSESLPATINNDRLCQNCPVKVECAIYQVYDGNDHKQNNVPPVNLNQAETFIPFSVATAHLSSNHLAFFHNWSKMLLFEFKTSKKEYSMSDIWCIGAKEREAKGQCLSNMKVQRSCLNENCLSEYEQYTIYLSRSEPFPDDTIIEIGDMVILSTDVRLASVIGSVINIQGSIVTITSDRNLNGKDDQVVHMDTMKHKGVDKILFSNLSRLMANTPSAKKLRGIIIDKNLPPFEGNVLPKSLKEKFKPILKSLNMNQQRAVLKALFCKHFCLINGLPGTGKTHLIVALIRLAAQLKLSVLLTSYTHSALDNVLLKLSQFKDVDFIRIGPQKRVPSSLLNYCADFRIRSCSLKEELDIIFDNRIVAATCLSISNPILMRRKFDLCIVDEAAQAMQLAIIGPLTIAERFVLVGDPLQLPPLVLNSEAKNLGMEESLFESLNKVIKSEKLTLQYRMCGPINELANQITYKNELICGNDIVRDGILDLPLYSSFAAKNNPTQQWLVKVINPILLNALVFLDTSMMGEKKNDFRTITGSIENHMESNIAHSIVSALCECGLKPDEIGIIAPYTSQVKLLKKKMSLIPLLEINTINQYQGRDKEVIIYSCTRSGRSSITEKASCLLNDFRRLTVAVTRAKYKLIIVGDKETLHHYAPFNKLFLNLAESQCYHLCPGKDKFL